MMRSCELTPNSDEARVRAVRGPVAFDLKLWIVRKLHMFMHR